jgi:glycerol-3-phosphate acyltransferase PlsX
MRIAIDAMGGDHAPEAVVKGVLSAVKQSRVEIILVGDREKILQHTRKRLLPERVSIVHTSQYVEMDENPTSALRKKKNSSILLAAQLLKNGEAQAMISAGNTGALLEAALITVGRLSGLKIRRPALSILLPTYKDHTLFLDVGANSDCKPEYLVQFARMGNVYAEKIMDRKNPRIGLLNIGSEKMKGNAMTLASYELLSNSGLNFVGNVEPRELFQGDVDIAVTDGFVGNMVLKTAEGTAELLIKLLKEYIKRNSLSKIAGLLLKPVFNNLKKKLDHTEYGGALLFGVNGICIKAHGRADPKTIQNAVRLARDIIQQDIIRRFLEDMHQEKEDAIVVSTPSVVN